MGNSRLVKYRLVLPPNGNLGVVRLECDLTVTRSASEEQRQFPRLRFGLLSYAKVDAKRPIFRLVLVKGKIELSTYSPSKQSGAALSLLISNIGGGTVDPDSTGSASAMPKKSSSTLA